MVLATHPWHEDRSFLLRVILCGLGLSVVRVRVASDPEF
jgi:hypothetical protein